MVELTKEQIKKMTEANSDAGLGERVPKHIRTTRQIGSRATADAIERTLETTHKNNNDATNGA